MNKPLEGWPLQPMKCPCDLDFIAWLSACRDLAPSPVFHMGTGLHHEVGIYCARHGIECFGLTASGEEAIARPGLSHDRFPGKYHVQLGNIYELDLAQIPELGCLTLFHLGELVDLFGPIQPEPIDGLIRRMRLGGPVLFYSGSSAWDRAKPYVDSRAELLLASGSYRSLEIYNRR